MNTPILIRDETGADVGAIAEVTVSAFSTLEISNHTEQFITEQFIVAALRAAKALMAVRLRTGSAYQRRTKSSLKECCADRHWRAL